MKFARNILLPALLFALARPALAQDSDPKPVTARIVLQNRQSWSVQVIGRFFTDRILIRKQGDQGTIELPIADIGRMDFDLPANVSERLDQYQADNLDGAAPGLERILTPYHDYISDAPGNLTPLVEALMRSYYHLGRIDSALRLADHVLSKTSTGRIHTDAACIKVLSLLAQGKTPEAADTANELGLQTASRTAQVLYTLSALLLRQGQLARAQETLAKLVTFHARDLEWMPPALLLSAEGYARAGHLQVAEQVVEEIALNFPNTRWVSRARALDLQQFLPAVDAEEEAATSIR